MEIRNDYGYPVDPAPQSLSIHLLGFDLFAPVKQPQPEGKFERARKYAAEARVRNAHTECEVCRQAEVLQTVIQITRNWK